MDWFERLNRAVDFIEDHLTDEIDYAQAADRAFCSVYHFFRVFYSLSGITPAEYRRRRRLSLAANDLQNGDARIIDIAARYGYDSPSAFSRAFRKQFGLTPNRVRHAENELRPYRRLSFTPPTRSVNEMDHRIIELPTFRILGRSVTFGVADGEFSKRGRTYWAKYVQSEDYKRLCDINGGKNGPVTNAPVMTAYLANSSGTWDPVMNVFGIEISADADPAGYEVFDIPAGTYAEFACTMADSTTVNRRIYGEWLPSSGYEHAGTADIASLFQMPFNRTIYSRWLIPVIKID